MSESSRNESAPRVPFWNITPRRRWLEFDAKELWRYRDLLLTLAWRDIAVHYKQTVLGMAWAVIQPLAGMIVFTIIFSRMAALPTDDVPAPLFYYAGLVAWTFFAQTVSGASQSLIEGSRLITKVYFPRIMIPASAMGYTFVNFFISAMLLIPLMIWYGVMPGANAIFLPVLLLCLGMTAFGVGVLIAALNVKYRDFRYVVPFLLQLWMFATPVVYPAGMIPERWRWLAGLNPLTGLVSGFRDCLLGRASDWSLLMSGAVLGGVACIIGAGYFRHVEDEMADIL